MTIKELQFFFFFDLSVFGGGWTDRPKPLGVGIRRLGRWARIKRRTAVLNHHSVTSLLGAVFFPGC